MAKITQNVLNEDLKNLENKISLIALSDPEKYRSFSLRINRLQDSLVGISDLGFEKRMQAVIEEVTSLQVDFDAYMDGSDALPEDSLIEGKELTSGRAKLREYRIGLYKNILEDLKRLDYIDIEDLRKLNLKWKGDKENEEYRFSPFEISVLDEALSDAFLDYQIKKVQKNWKLPGEHIEDFTTLEEYQKSLKKKLIEISKSSNISFNDKMELDSLLQEQDLEKLISSQNIWKLLTSKSIEISNDDASKNLNKEIKENTNTEKEETTSTALVPIEAKKQGFLTNLFSKKPYMIITLEDENGKQTKKKIKLPDGVAKIPSKYTSLNDEGYHKNSNDSKTIEVFLSEGVKGIADFGFADCEDLRVIHLPSTIKEESKDAFKGCNNVVKNVYLPNSTEKFILEGFGEKKDVPFMVLMVEGKNGERIPEKVKLKDGVVDLPRKYRTLSDTVSKEESPVLEVIFSKGVQEIADGAFINCTKLESVDFSSSDIKIIGDDAFKNCRKLAKVKGITSIEEIGHQAFYGCTSIENDEKNGIKIEDQNEPIKPKGPPYMILTLEEIGFFTGKLSISKQKIKLPDGVAKLPEAYRTVSYPGEPSDVSPVTEVVFSEGVTKITQKAFEDCFELKKVELPNSLVEIEEEAFAGCSKLSKVEMPSSNVKVAPFAFRFCHPEITYKENTNTKSEQTQSNISTKQDIFPKLSDTKDGVVNVVQPQNKAVVYAYKKPQTGVTVEEKKPKLTTQKDEFDEI